jgi:signal peptidase II
VREIAILLAWSAVFFALDQGSKRLVLSRVADRSIAVSPLLTLRRIAGRKAMYERTGGRVAFVLVWVFALLSIALLLRSGAWFHTSAARVGLAAALGGAAGNLFDILRRRAVIDFIDLRWWPAFNVADVAIVGGLIVAFWLR